MFRQFRDLKRGEFIIAAADCSAGGNDWSACQFLSKNRLDVPLVYHSKLIATEMTSALYPVLNKIADITGVKPLVAYERNNGGFFEMERLAALNREGKYDIFRMPSLAHAGATEYSVRYGWDTNSATRPAMLAALKEAIDKGLIRIYDLKTIEEFLSFVVMQTSSSWKAQAERNAHDDLVMALAIAWQLYIMSPTVYEKASELRKEDYVYPHQNAYTV